MALATWMILLPLHLLYGQCSISKTGCRGLISRATDSGYKVADPEVVALQGLDLEAAPGEMLTIVGASGSGKSTLVFLPRLPNRSSDPSFQRYFRVH